MPWLVLVEDVVQQTGSTGFGEELGAETDQATGRDDVLHPNPTGAVIDHLFHTAFTKGHQLGNNAEIILGDIDGEMLHRLVHLAVDNAGDDLRLAHGELEAFTTHDFHENRQLEFASTLNLPRVRAVSWLKADGDVTDEFGVQPVLHQACGQLVTALAS